MAGVYLLHVRNNSSAEIAERTASQLKVGEWIERVVVVVVVVHRQFLLRGQDLVEADLELISSLPGFHHILDLRACATRSRQILHQADCHRIEAPGRNYSTGKNRIVWRWCAGGGRIQT